MALSRTQSGQAAWLKEMDVHVAAPENKTDNLLSNIEIHSAVSLGTPENSAIQKLFIDYYYHQPNIA